MQFDQRIGDGETEARSLHAIDHHCGGLFEWPTQPHKVLGGDAGAIIRDGKMDELRDRSGAD